MSQPDAHTGRRRFLHGVAAVAVTLAGLPLTAQCADELPSLSESDPTATALGYKDDASKVDPAKFPQLKPNQTCATCNFYQGKGARAPCSLFPGKSVAAKGWCSAYAVKP